MVVHDTSVYCALQQYEVSFKYLYWLSTYTERTRNSIANDQREITPKISKAEIWFLCMTHRFIVLYNSMKFHLNSFIGCQLTQSGHKIALKMIKGK